MAIFTGDEGDNTIAGLEEDDTINGAQGDDVLSGLGGNDLLIGGDGADQLNGGDGDDALIADAGVDFLDGGANFDTAVFADRTGPIRFEIDGGLWSAFDEASLDGATGLVIGQAQNVESVVGTNSGDTFNIASTFSADEGNFINIRGLGGNDTINALGNLGDVIVRADYRNANAGVLVDLQAGSARSAQANDLAGVGVDTLFQVLQVRGSNFGDQLLGSNSAIQESFRPEGGNDFIDGRGGQDRLDYLNAPLGVTVDMATGITLQDGFGFRDFFRNIENIRGSSNADTISGNAGSNFFQPLGGDDILNGRDEVDTVSYQFDTASPINVLLSAVSTVSGDVNVGTDQLIDIESVVGTSGDDRFEARADFDASFGQFNIFEGLAGDDVIIGNGFTRIEYDRSPTAGIFADLRAGLVRGDASVGVDTVSGIFEVKGTAFDDRLFGSDNAPDGEEGFESFNGLGGNNLIDGRGGIDRVNYFNAPGGVSVDLSADIALNNGFGQRDTLFNIENVRGSNFTDTLIGDDGNNVFEPQLGSDFIDGREGFDTIDYGLILSKISVDLRLGTVIHTNGDRQVVEDIEQVLAGKGDDDIVGTGGDNNVEGDDGDDRIVGLSGADELDGNEGDDVLFGNSGDDVLIGGNGDDRLNGGFGADRMEGGRGSDIYFVDNADDVIVEMANGGVDTNIVVSTVTFVLPAAVDNLLLGRASVVGINGTGNGNDNTIAGNGDNNVLAGLGGDDILNGGAGDDELIGGNGDDILIGGSEADSMRGDAGQDIFVIEFEGGSGNVIQDFVSGTDRIDFSEFGFANDFEALALFTDQEGGTRFVSEGVSYLVAGVSSADFFNGDFIL